VGIKGQSTLSLGPLTHGNHFLNLIRDSSCHICSAGDDAQALIWDLQTIPNPIEDPILAY